MTTTEVVLLCVLGVATVGVIVLLRRPTAPPPDAAALVRAELARLADGLARQGADDREIRADVARMRQTLEGLVPAPKLGPGRRSPRGRPSAA
jgi:hypothetical protein